MIFEVKIRNNMGVIDYVQIEAESRSALFAITKERGLTVVSVNPMDGKRKSITARRNKGSSPSPFRGLVALVSVLILASVVYVCIDAFSGKKASDFEQTPEVVKSSKKDHASLPESRRDVPRAGKVGSDEKPVVIEPKKEQWLGTDIDHKTAVTNGTKVVETIYTVDGKTHKYFRDIKPRVFDNASDQILAIATQGNGVGMAPPLPGLGGFEKSFTESLKKPIVIKDDDPPEVKAVKERVKQAREEMLQAISEGMSAEEVLREHQALQNDNAKTRGQMVAELKKYLDQGDYEAAQMFCDKINPVLAEMGIMGLELPRSAEEVRAERLQRRAMKDVKEEN